ncbi:MAG: hypothetical protein HYV07_02365 [Deltaproteobacteria bacterium]|nr:hypothetical protein [Deltaproteobacteria bacterium]
MCAPLAACSLSCGSPGPFFLPPPALEPSGVLYILDGEAPAAFVSTTTRASFRLEATEPITLDAWVLHQSLRLAGLSEGPLLSTPGSGRHVGDLEQAEAFHADLDRGEWVRSTPTTADFEIPLELPREPAGCLSFRVTPMAVPDATPTSFALSIGDGVLVGFRSGLVIRSFDVRTKPLELDPPFPSLSAGALGPDGELWLMSIDGAFFRGVSAGDRIEARQEARNPYASDYSELLAARTGTTTVVFSAGDSGHVARFANGRWAPVHDFLPGSEATRDPAMALFGNDLFVASGGSSSILRVPELGTDTELEPTPSSQGLTALGVAGSLGLIAGSSGGQFYRRLGGRWEELKGSRLSVFPFALEAFRGGFVFSGFAGIFGQYTPNGPRSAGAMVHHIAVDGDRIVLAGTDLAIVEPIE